MKFAKFIKNNNYTKIQTLLQKYPDFINKKDSGSTPLTVACYHGNTNIIKLLLDHGADPNIYDDIGNNAFNCLFNGDYDHTPKNVYLLLEYGKANPNIIHDGLPILVHMCLQGDYETAELLLAYDAFPNDVFEYSKDIEKNIIELVLKFVDSFCDDDLLQLKNYHKEFYKKIDDYYFNITKNIFINHLPSDIINIIHRMNFV
jgi:ankyrin repeat protein